MIWIRGLEIERYWVDNNSNKTFIHIHGLHSNYYDFCEKYEDLITEKGYNILAFNLPGHGKSSEWLHEEDITLTYLVELSYDVIQTIPRQTQLYLHGHSLGGAIALTLNVYIDLDIAMTIAISPVNRTSPVRLAELNRYYLPKTLKDARRLLSIIYHQGGEYRRSNKLSDIRSDIIELRNNPNRFNNYRILIKNLASARSLMAIDAGIMAANPLHLFFGADDEIIDKLEIAEYFLQLNKNTQVYTRPKMRHTPWRDDPAFYRRWLDRTLT